MQAASSHCARACGNATPRDTRKNVVFTARMAALWHKGLRRKGAAAASEQAAAVEQAR
jgi:hypothetical protein